MIRLPEKIKYDDKKVGSKVDLALAKQQLETLTEILKEAGINVIELAPEKKGHYLSLFPDDAAIVIHGTALLTRPKKQEGRFDEIAQILKELTWNVVRCEEKENGHSIILEGSDVLFTGKEIFVGIRKDGTNMEGASIVAKTFPDIPVMPIYLPNKLPLKHYFCMVKEGVLSYFKCKDSDIILERLNREATYKYQILSLDQDTSSNCLNVNDHLIYRGDINETKFNALKLPIELWGINVSELIKIGGSLTRFCLLINKINSKKGILL
ncbi:Amidinotransferase family-containing protein [Strongyloides ratti]|uniref:Amidinotransferase family-containing protein n=1 Tax=Strongyloides ratti TaxID=34506 RepID=A0A090L3M2_STRRB|nr:Amidinotransferase family-containing protein [Strongyloides ratti]CEF64312.1 Amidinotransferase family-containing protein [Strongyloides ratti]